MEMLIEKAGLSLYSTANERAPKWKRRKSFEKRKWENPAETELCLLSHGQAQAEQRGSESGGRLHPSYSSESQPAALQR